MPCEGVHRRTAGLIVLACAFCLTYSASRVVQTKGQMRGPAAWGLTSWSSATKKSSAALRTRVPARAPDPGTCVSRELLRLLSLVLLIVVPAVVGMRQQRSEDDHARANALAFQKMVVRPCTTALKNSTI